MVQGKGGKREGPREVFIESRLRKVVPLLSLWITLTQLYRPNATHLYQVAEGKEHSANQNEVTPMSLCGRDDGVDVGEKKRKRYERVSWCEYNEESHKWSFDNGRKWQEITGSLRKAIIFVRKCTEMGKGKKSVWSIAAVGTYN